MCRRSRLNVSIAWSRVVIPLSGRLMEVKDVESRLSTATRLARTVGATGNCGPEPPGNTTKGRRGPNPPMVKLAVIGGRIGLSVFATPHWTERNALVIGSRA